MSAPEIVNETELVVLPHVVLDADGEMLVTIIKGSFEQDAEGALVPARTARPIRFGDEWWGDPATTPVRYPADATGFKPGTDVIVVADGHAPEGEPVKSFDVAVRVGPLAKTLRVFGLRVWQDAGAGLSAPRPVLQQTIRYDHAWGGLDEADPTIGDCRNPVGRGAVADRSSLTHQPAPCIEDPLHLISNTSTAQLPAGFGAIGPHWLPRREHVGSYDEAWQRDQAPLLPQDYDARANQCGSPGLIATPHLRGGEEVGLLNLHPGGGPLAFVLPAWRPILTFARRGRTPEQVTPVLDTVVIDTLDVQAPSRVIVELTWRAVTTMPRFGRELQIVVAA
jgi:hypothetical protein